MKLQDQFFKENRLDMNETFGETRSTVGAQDQETSSQRQERWLATGGIVGAIMAASCCVVPLILVTLGVSGAWIGSLTALEPYKPYFLAVAAILLGAGFWHVYMKPQRACAEGSYCARPRSGHVTQAVLWLATALALLAATVDYWAPLFY